MKEGAEQESGAVHRGTALQKPLITRVTFHQQGKAEDQSATTHEEKVVVASGEIAPGSQKGHNKKDRGYKERIQQQ